MDETKDVETQDTDTPEAEPLELSGEALDAHLEKRLSEEESPSPEPVAESQADANKAPASQEATTQDADKGQATVTEQEDVGETEVEKLLRVAADNKAFIDKQGNELGILRSRALELEKAALPKLNPEDIQERMSVDPAQTLRQIEEHNSQINEFNTRQEQTYRHQTEDAVKRAFPDIEKLLPGMVELARSEGASEDALRSFQVDPYREDLGSILGYAHRVRQSEHIASLEAELKESQTRATGVTAKIQKAAGIKPTVTDSTGTTSRDSSVTMEESQIDQLTGEDLNRYLEERIQAESGG